MNQEPDLAGVRRLWNGIVAEGAARLRAEAPDFNVFDFLRCDEYGLSSVIAWLLDPRGTHGQADLFLRRFLSDFGIRVQFGGEVVVRMEVPTHLIEARSRRIDVHLRIGGFVLAIENKPYAGWQDRQVVDYLRQIEAEAMAGSCLVVLRGYGDAIPAWQLDPSIRGELVDAGRLVDADYDILRRWAAGCAADCAAPRVGLLIGDFVKLIERTFDGMRPTSDEHRLAAAVLAGDELEAALRVMSAADDILSGIALRCRADIESGLRQPLALLETTPEPARRWTGFAIELDQRAPFFFAVEFNSTRLSDPYLGLKLRRTSRSSRPLPEIRDAVERQGVDPGYAESNWIWWNWFGRPAEGGRAELWVSLFDGSFATRVVKLASIFDQALRAEKVLPWSGVR